MPQDGAFIHWNIIIYVTRLSAALRLNSAIRVSALVVVGVFGLLPPSCAFSQVRFLMMLWGFLRFLATFMPGQAGEATIWLQVKPGASSKPRDGDLGVRLRTGRDEEKCSQPACISRGLALPSLTLLSYSLFFWLRMAFICFVLVRRDLAWARLIWNFPCLHLPSAGMAGVV